MLTKSLAQSRRGAGMTEWILIVLVVAIALLAAVTIFGRKVSTLAKASSESLDEGKAKGTGGAGGLYRGTGVTPYLPDLANPVPEGLPSPANGPYGPNSGAPDFRNPRTQPDPYVNPLQGGTPVDTFAGGTVDAANPPARIEIPPAMGDAFNAASQQSVTADAEVALTIVRNSVTGELTTVNNVQAVGNRSVNPDVTTGIAPPQVVVGTYHTHPAPVPFGYGTPFSGGDTPWAVENVSFLQSGTDVFAIVRTSTAPMPPSAAAWSTAWNATYNAAIAAGHNVRDARYMATRDAAHAVGYEFYVGDSGNTTLTRVP